MSMLRLVFVYLICLTAGTTASAQQKKKSSSKLAEKSNLSKNKTPPGYIEYYSCMHSKPSKTVAAIDGRIADPQTVCKTAAAKGCSNLRAIIKDAQCDVACGNAKRKIVRETGAGTDEYSCKLSITMPKGYKLRPVKITTYLDKNIKESDCLAPNKTLPTPLAPKEKKVGKIKEVRDSYALAPESLEFAFVRRSELIAGEQKRIVTDGTVLYFCAEVPPARGVVSTRTDQEINLSPTNGDRPSEADVLNSHGG